MAKSIIVEGKTSTEAIENGLKQLKVSKDKVEIKILESEEKSSGEILQVFQKGYKIKERILRPAMVSIVK